MRKNMSDDHNNKRNNVWYIISLGLLLYMVLYYLIDKGYLTLQLILHWLPGIIAVGLMTICIMRFIWFIRKIR